ncbi:hypothetical protein [Alkalibacterium thalassium]|uniref:Uncharacterized protein n=1 Tax=Alkalibacterium thalassium TaxID=426701 RepID=A0A1G9F1K5_9LACT|nr:hypothetical protein [Alkalibacterium thalassium]SDK82317.1 hypothetical protein SAMN04488098_107010 [Alkalibacterium thalassium]
MIKSESFSESDRVEDPEITDNESDSSEEINTEDTAVDSKDELSDTQNMPLNVTAFNSLIDKKKCTNEAGYQSWIDYKHITSAYTLGDLTGSTEDEGSVTTFYFITMGEAIVQYATVPFLETAQDFATYSVMVFIDFFSTLNSMQ